MEMRFSAQGLSPLEYFENINKWLAEHNGIRPLRLCVGEFVQSESDKPRVYECTLIYDSEGEVKTTYAMSYYHKISGVKIGLDVMKSFWQEANPHAKIALCSYCHTVNKLAEAAYDINGSVIANCNCMWIIYEKCEDILEFTPADFYHSSYKPAEETAQVNTEIKADAEPLEPMQNIIGICAEEVPVEPVAVTSEVSVNVPTQPVAEVPEVSVNVPTQPVEEVPEVFVNVPTQPVAVTPVQPVQQMAQGEFCGYCGKRNAPGAVFCGFCGKKMFGAN